MTRYSRLNVLPRLAVLVAAAGLLAMAWPAAAQIPTGAPTDLFRNDVHQKAGLTCDSCHGKPTGSTYAPIARTNIARICGTCHADAGYMGKFDPHAKLNQLALYQTSVHGKQMAKGETRVATCSDCHGAHGVLAVKDAASPVAPPHVATTCARCHSDPERMKAFRLPNAPDDWNHSVHAAALQHGDSSAPTCSTCHNAHGVLPEGVAKLDEVCWTCHVREADLYKASPKKKIFDENDHPGCVTCHEEHKIVKPNDSFIGIKGDAVCATCHDAEMKGADEIALEQTGLARLTSSIDGAGAVLDRAEQAGMLVDDGRQALRDAREHQIQARVSVHTFVAKPFSAAADQGLKDAARAEQAGKDALAERQYRRRGLAVATLLILGFLATLWIQIRRLPEIPPPASDSSDPRHPTTGTNYDRRA